MTIDINMLTISFVLERLDKHGITRIVVSRTADYNKIAGILEKFDNLVEGSDSNILIRDI
jgi:hypothetical protein